MTFWPHRQQEQHFLLRYELPLCITAFDYQKSLESIYLAQPVFLRIFPVQYLCRWQTKKELLAHVRF